MITRSGETRDSYNSRWFRAITFDPLDVRRHAPDKRETCHNLTKLALMTKFEKARMAYEKQYVAMAPRYLKRKKGVLTRADDGIRRMREVQPSKE